MTTTLVSRNEAPASLVEQVVLHGDLGKLSPEERLAYYIRVCDSLGLNPYTWPFDYIMLNGKLTLYAKRDCADQLRKVHGVSIMHLEDKQVGEIYTVRATARDKTGREDVATGAVSIKGKQGEDLANCFLKAETKAKRRVTLSLCGLGWLDETEVASVPGVQPVPALTVAVPSQRDRLLATLQPPETPAEPHPVALDEPHWLDALAYLADDADRNDTMKEVLLKRFAPCRKTADLAAQDRRPFLLTVQDEFRRRKIPFQPFVSEDPQEAGGRRPGRGTP